MHQESREHKKAISDRLDKLEQDYSQMNMYLNDSGSHGQYDDGNDEYQNQADPYGHGPGPSINESYDDSNANDHDDAVSDTAESAGQSVSDVQDIINKDQMEPTASKTAGVTAPKSRGFSSKYAYVEEVGPPVNKTLEEEVDFMLTNRLQDAKIADVVKSYHPPSNLKRLKSPKVNLPIWTTISESFRKNDTRLQMVQTSL